MMTIGSLCSGACDGLSLGLEWAGLGPTIWQIEKEYDRRDNLERHWPDADRTIVDVYDVAAFLLPRPGIIVCSSPCQDLSSAGARAGLDGPRSRAWFACQRIIGTLQPRFAVVENVASGAGNWVPHVRSGLEGYGYTTLPIPLAAADCGAPHLRRRVFVLAYLDDCGEHAEPVDGQVGRASPHVGHADGNGLREQLRRGQPGRAHQAVGAADGAHAGWPTELEVVPPIHGVPGRVVSWLGDAVVPQCAEVIGWVIRELAGLTPETNP